MRREKIRDLRKARGWSISRLAERVGVSRSYMAHIERGTRQLNEHRLHQIADALGVDPASLISATIPPSEIETHVSLVTGMNPEDRKKVFDYAELIYRARMAS